MALQASFNIDLIQKLSFQTCLYTTRDGGSEGREGGEGGKGGEGGEGGMTVMHILIGMFNSIPMIPQYLNNNLT